MGSEEGIRLQRRLLGGGVVLATGTGAATPVASVLQAPTGTASVGEQG